MKSVLFPAILFLSLTSQAAIIGGQVINVPDEKVDLQLEQFNSVDSQVPSVQGWWRVDEAGLTRSIVVLMGDGGLCEYRDVSRPEGSVVLHLTEEGKANGAKAPIEARDIMTLRCDQKIHSLQDVDGVLKIETIQIPVCNNPMC